MQICTIFSHVCSVSSLSCQPLQYTITFLLFSKPFLPLPPFWAVLNHILHVCIISNLPYRINSTSKFIFWLYFFYWFFFFQNVYHSMGKLRVCLYVIAGLTYRDKPIKLTYNCGKKPEHPEETQAGTGRPCQCALVLVLAHVVCFV